MGITGCTTCPDNIKFRYTFQCFSFLIFPLLDTKKYCTTLRNLDYNNYILNLEDCFIYNQKIDCFFTQDNMMYCNYCGGLRPSMMCTKIYTAPLVLILILNRGKGNLDFQEPFIFWENINLTNYLEYKDQDNNYFLIGVVSHLGESGAGGHFIAFCRMSPQDSWYRYNDSMVSISNFNEINNCGTPYILFYQKVQMS